ncbi:MAG: glycosyltransferase family 39 protein, partial [Anaerolineae bacterium]|nr:glycosyltransferase family 39 protein [Anaerolineae bacterium]
ITRLLLPQQPALALATAALVAFLPQHVAILASINNDALGNLLVALTLLALLHHLQGAAVRPWHLGLLVGIGLLTKVSTIFLAGLVPLMLIIQGMWVQRVALTVLVRRLIAFALPALLLGGLWWLRSISVYG